MGSMKQEEKEHNQVEDWAVEMRACFKCKPAEDVRSTRELVNREEYASNALRKLTGRALRVEIRDGFLHIWEALDGDA